MADYENVFLDPLLDCNVYELELLKFLEDEPSASVLDITKSLNLSRSLLDKTIQSLINKGFLVREKIGHKTRWIVKAHLRSLRVYVNIYTLACSWL